MISFFGSALSKNGVLGINQRNGDFVQKYNPRKFYPLVDDKLQTKKLALQAGLAIPELYGIVEIAHDVRGVHSKLTNPAGFVAKPARGSGGEGVLVVSGKVKDMFRLVSGRLLSDEMFAHHLLNILSGMYSLGGHPDQAILEYRVEPDPVFEEISYKGVPDIRIIVFLGVPVMAMVRLPTSLSDGKANLHQGAIGVGIDLATGITISAVSGNSSVMDHPDTGVSVIGITIPNWDRLLEIACRTFDLTKLGYQGVDIVLDRNKGPMILELNARPGLNIQIANSAGLVPRLRLIEKEWQGLTRLEDRIRFAKEEVAGMV